MTGTASAVRLVPTIAAIGIRMATPTNATAMTIAIVMAGSIAARRRRAAGASASDSAAAPAVMRRARPASRRPRIGGTRPQLLGRGRRHFVLEALGQALARLTGGLEVVLDQVDLVEIDRCLVDCGIRVGRQLEALRLVRADLLGRGLEHPVDPRLRRVRLGRAGEKCDATDLVAGPLLGEADLEVAEAGLQVSDAVMAEDDRHGHFAATRHRGRSGARARVLQDVRMDGLGVFDRLVLATQPKDLREQGGVRGPGAGRVSDGDLALEGRIGKVIPRVGNLNAKLIEDRGVRAEAQCADVDTGPHAVGVLLAVGDRLGVRRLIWLAHALSIRRDEAVGRTAPPDAELGSLGAGLQAGECPAGAPAGR